VTALIEVWDIFEQPCGQRLVPAPRSELERLRKLGEVRCSTAVAEQLKEISAAALIGCSDGRSRCGTYGETAIRPCNA
jgi:hypothetical protein